MSSTGLKGVNAYTYVYIYIHFTHEKDIHLQNQNDLVNFMVPLGLCYHCFVDVPPQPLTTLSARCSFQKQWHRPSFPSKARP